MKTVSSPGDLPPGRHLAILTFGSVTIPGDERSRTNPGHGYPEYAQPTMECEVYLTQEEWERAIARKAADKYGNTQWVPVVLTRPEVKTIIKVDFGEQE